MSATKMFSIVAATLALAAGVTLIFFLRNVSATDNVRTVDIEETVKVDDLGIMAESIEFGSSETILEVEFKAASKKGITPVGLPSIKLSDGTVVKASNVNNGTVSGTGGGSWDRTYTFPSIADQTGNIHIDLASHILYDYSAHTVNLPLRTAVSQTRHSSVTEPETHKLNGTFSIDDAEFKLTSLVLKPKKFSITFKPNNATAGKMVVAATLSNATLRDNLASIYKNGLTLAEWNKAQDKVVSQTLVFNGLLNAEATGFTLSLDGLGAIKTAGTIPVQVSDNGSSGAVGNTQ